MAKSVMFATRKIARVVFAMVILNSTLVHIMAESQMMRLAKLLAMHVVLYLNPSELHRWGL